MAAENFAMWQQKIDEALREGKERLSLNRCELGDEEMKHLSSAVLKNKEARVKTLILGDNNIGDEGVRNLSEGIKENQTLKVLVLNNNNVGDRGMVYLSEAIKANETLTTLWLDDNNIGNVGLESLRTAASVNTSLTYVSLFYSTADLSDQSNRDLTHALATDMSARQAAREEYLSFESSRMVKSAAKR